MTSVAGQRPPRSIEDLLTLLRALNAGRTAPYWRENIEDCNAALAEIARLREIAKAAQWLDLYLHTAPRGFAALVPSACRANWNSVAQKYWPQAHWRQPRLPIEETRAQRWHRRILGAAVIAIMLYLGFDSEIGATAIGLFRIEVLGW